MSATTAPADAAVAPPQAVPAPPPRRLLTRGAGLAVVALGAVALTGHGVRQLALFALGLGRA